MRRAVGQAFVASVSVNYGSILEKNDIIPKIDGTVAGVIAVEIQAGWSKAARAAISDLICSDPYPSKLLVVIGPPNSQECAARIREHCDKILERFLPRERFQVILLEGNRNTPQWDADLLHIRDALRELGWSNQAQ